MIISFSSTDKPPQKTSQTPDQKIILCVK